MSGEPSESKEPAMSREEAEALSRRRPLHCIEAWPECHSDDYDPRCCRFPKSCSPFYYPEAFMVGNATAEDVEAPQADVTAPLSASGAESDHGGRGDGEGLG